MRDVIYAPRLFDQRKFSFPSFARVSQRTNPIMGVTGLWTVVQPCARPIKLETLNKKRLAVDASIWIYQFLKAVRDKEGNALRNSHVVGFFRRICKLLFFGIKPVFVFDGGAPILKRQTVSGRRARREGRREDAVRTAGKLLAVQMQRRAEEEDDKRRREAAVNSRRKEQEDDEEEAIPENPTYVGELGMTEQERLQGRHFRKKDAYHLPHLDVDLADMGAPNDPRIMSHEELEEYARQFHTGEDVNVYDFSKIDFESPFFLSLPASDRYNILNAARLRSRLRMGYSKEQLDTMFPNRMDFSRFQIERVKERNELTQRLMNINGMNGEDAMFGIDNGARIAGEKGKEYVLVKNDGVEGGWALGVVSNREGGERSKPIDVERFDKNDEEPEDEGDEWEDDGFEDVPIEGLNRLPKRPARDEIDPDHLPFESEEAAKRRRALYDRRITAAGRKPPPTEAAQASAEEEDSDALFVEQADEANDGQYDMQELFEDVPAPPEDVVEPAQEDEDDELQRAIALSLVNNEDGSASETELPTFSSKATRGPRIDRPLDFNQKNAKAGRDFAHLTNARAHGHAPKPFADDSEDDDFDLQAGLRESRESKRKPTTGPRAHGFKRPDGEMQTQAAEVANEVSQPEKDNAGFDGPLPFESLSLGKSILGKKKKKPAEEEAGGFDKDADKEKPAQPLPPWFSGDIRDEVAKQKAIEQQQSKGQKKPTEAESLADSRPLRRHETGEVIDLDAPNQKQSEPINVESSSEEDDEDAEIVDAREPDTGIIMDDVAALARVEPPVAKSPSTAPILEAQTSPTKPILNGDDGAAEEGVAEEGDLMTAEREEPSVASKTNEDLPELQPLADESEEEAPLDWSDSENEDEAPTKSKSPQIHSPHISQPTKAATKSASPSFDDIGLSISQDQASQPNERPDEVVSSQSPPSLPKDTSTNTLAFNALDEEEGPNEADFSDPEDEDLFRALATEAQEHARFASSLNDATNPNSTSTDFHTSHLQSAADYERELKQLRSQQKKDRRDADEVTTIMITECQQLLKLFGLPYVTAPMEAEAQCASLVSLGLVDGIVTDDSDIFLFGGTRVYKNMFNQAKFVECYLASDLEKEYSLTREKLIRFAHLLGSDYTEGLPSVGPVTALEILSEFDSLQEFSEWWEKVQMTSSKSAAAELDAGSSFRRKFRRNASKIFLPTTFPDTRVDQAYLHPEVDKDPSPFQWGVPDLDALRQYLMATIGWSQERTDEVLVPVIKDMNRRENEGTQANITQFFSGGVGVGAMARDTGGAGASAGAGGQNGGGQAFAPRRRGGEGKSKRMESALGRLHQRAKGGNEAAAVEDGQVSNATAAEVSNAKETRQSRKRTKTKKRGPPEEDADEVEDNDRGGDLNGEDEDDTEDDAEEYQAPSKPKRRGKGQAKSRKRAKATQ